MEKLTREDWQIANQIAIINLLGALAEKLTGEKPVVTYKTKAGKVNIEPTTTLVSWSQPE